MIGNKPDEQILTGLTKLADDTLSTDIKTVDYMRNNISCQVTAQLSLTEKSELYALIHSKGCAGLTAFLKMLSKAKEVQIKI